MFSTQSKTEIMIVATFKLSSANALTMAQSKKMSYGKELTLYQTITCFNGAVEDTFGKHCGEKEDCLGDLQTPCSTSFL